MENASKALIIAGAILIAILLITIGIVLINSGRDVTERGTAAMKSQAIQSFNAQFTPYEGTITGSQIKSLLSTVRSSNAVDDAHQVAVMGSESLNNIKDELNYNVVLAYADHDDIYKYIGNWIKPDVLYTEKGYIFLIKVSNI